jgi:hypothetical protein
VARNVFWIIAIGVDTNDLLERLAWGLIRNWRQRRDVVPARMQAENPSREWISQRRGTCVA